MTPARAVVFDFYGTLSVGASAEERRAMNDRVADALGVPRDCFEREMVATFAERATGRLGDLRQSLEELARRCGTTPDDGRLAEGARVRLTSQTRFTRMLRPDSVDVLVRLRRMGTAIGLVSDCTHELPLCWSELPVAPYVDATVFSVEFGEKKPHPSIYLEVCRRLGVRPEDVVYVGDGGSNELSGAAAVGMSPVLLAAPDGPGSLVYEREEHWAGPVIGDLAGVVDLVPGRGERRGGEEGEGRPESAAD